MFHSCQITVLCCRKVFRTGFISESGNETQGNVHATNASILLPVKEKFLIPFPSPDRTRKD